MKKSALALRRGIPAASLAALALLAGCFTEVGNPGKTQQVNATFTIDYAGDPPPLPKTAQGNLSVTDTLRILHFRFNVVEVNYQLADNTQGRIWKVPDSLGQNVDFTGQDTLSALPPVRVPPGEWTIMKLESRIPLHDTLHEDTLDFTGFKNPGYIKGSLLTGGQQHPFLVQLPADYKINLVYSQALLEKWKSGDVYNLQFIFYAKKWLSAVLLPQATTFPDRQGAAVAIIDEEHNPDLYLALWKSFFKSFNSNSVWKENPATWPQGLGP